jgi:Mrp family chromosome partitioning ATPase/capsular polysaccharide biosynthesis protein
MDPLDYLKILRRRWLVVAACGLVAVVAAVVTLPSAPSSAGRSGPTASVTSYKATTTLLQTTADASTVPASTLPVFVRSGDVPKAAAKTLDFEGDPNLLGQRVSLTPDPDAGTIAITVTDPDADQAIAIANAFSTALIEFLRKRAQSDIDRKIQLLEDVLVRYQNRKTSIDGADSLSGQQRAALDNASSAVQQEITRLQVSSATAGFDLDILQPATAVPLQAKGSSVIAGGTGNRWARALVLVLVGLGLGLALALAVERFDTRLRGRMASEAALRLPVVASVPALPHHRRGRHEVTSAVDPLSAVAESYRALRSAAQLLPSRPVEPLPHIVGGIALPLPADEVDRAPVRDPRVLLVVSASAGEGKTTSIANLAFVMAEANRRVIVLDCDFRHPEAHHYLGVPTGRGLSDLLAADREVPLASILQPTSIPGVHLAQAGTSTQHPGALMGLVGRYVAEATELADVVLVDAPPALVASDAVDLMPTVQAVVVVVREGRTSRADAERLSTLLSQLRVPCVGVVQVAARDAGAAYFKSEATKRRPSRTTVKHARRAVHGSRNSTRGGS